MLTATLESISDRLLAANVFRLMTSFTLLSRVRRPEDGPLPAWFLPAPSLVTRPPAPSRAARRGVATGRTISDTLAIGFLDVYARALTLFAESVEVVEAMVFETLLLLFPPAQYLFFSYPRLRLIYSAQMMIISSLKILLPQASRIVLREGWPRGPYAWRMLPILHIRTDAPAREKRLH